MNKMTALLTGLFLAAGCAALPASDVFGLHKVEKIEAPDRVQINFNRLPICVHLAHIKATPEAQAKLEELLKDKSIALKFADELGTDDSGEPYVYVLLGTVNVNVKLVEDGLATYDTSVAKSKLYDAAFAKAQAAAPRQPDAPATQPAATPTARPTATPAKPTTAAAPVGSKIVAELRGSFYHLPTCKKVQQLSSNNLIYFAAPELAEKAGKRPCWTCLADRADAAAFGGHEITPNLAVKVGHLIGLKSNPKFFYSPTAPALHGVDLGDMIGFATLAEAKASGREPDPGCLRLTAPPGEQFVPPKAGECIGRSPPFYRPCYRAPADESGLCTVCQGRE